MMNRQKLHAVLFNNQTRLVSRRVGFISALVQRSSAVFLKISAAHIFKDTLVREEQLSSCLNNESRACRDARATVN